VANEAYKPNTLANDAGFNPNVGDTTEWRRMTGAPSGQ
jgi:hypothetical protein